MLQMQQVRTHVVTCGIQLQRVRAEDRTRQRTQTTLKFWERSKITVSGAGPGTRVSPLILNYRIVGPTLVSFHIELKPSSCSSG